ncbi:MAG: aldehyde dehydrogenase family protein [Thermoplasmata archaeon]
MAAVEYGLFIQGRWAVPASATRFCTLNPATGEEVGSFVAATSAHARAAIDAAQAAYPSWRDTPAPTRGALLLRAAGILRERKEALARLVTQEMGKILAEGRGDVQESIDFVEYMAGEGRRLTGETVPSELPSKFCLTVRQPKGVVSLITPWNFPTSIPNWKIAAALVCGNTIVFKPASATSACAAEVVRAYADAGLPPGVLNLVTGSGGAVGEVLLADPRIRAVSFTGGVETGREVYARAARELKMVHLELGGKNPMIVMDDARLDLALDGILFGAFGTAGQRCTATSRLILHEPIYASFLEQLLERVRRLKIGDPLDPATEMGPVGGPEQERKILEYIAVGQKEGAILRTGGHKLTDTPFEHGHYIEPTVFEARPDHQIATEEIFGPVLSVLRARDYEEAVAIANGVDYGLSSAIYTSSVELAFRAVHDFEAGITYVNAPTIGAEVQLPFGGLKNTGNGGREAGSAAIDEFTEIKTVFFDYSNRLQKAQIDTPSG